MLHLIKKKFTGNKTVFHTKETGKLKTFDEEVFVQSIKQHIDKAFQRINLSINKERQLLAELIEKGDFERAKRHLRIENTYNAKKTRFNENNENKPPSVNRRKGSYVEVLKLAGRGMTTRKISEKVKIPKGEIEMLLKVRKKRRKVI